LLLLFGKDDLEWNKDPMIPPGASNNHSSFHRACVKHTQEFCAKNNVPKLPGNNKISEIVVF
jgi:hypothetical protein